VTAGVNALMARFLIGRLFTSRCTAAQEIVILTVRRSVLPYSSQTAPYSATSPETYCPFVTNVWSQKERDEWRRRLQACV